MKFHDQLLKDIEATYFDRPIDQNNFTDNYATLCAKHKVLIDSIKNELISVNDQMPTVGSHSLCVEDLTPMGKGIFLTDFWYNEYGFVSEPDNEDAYGYITHWTYLRLEND